MSGVRNSVAIQAAGVVLEADLVVPESARGAVLFAHGSGSSRHSPRNVYVAGELQRAGLTTLLADLLTAEEERLDARKGQLRFDIGLLATRLIALTDFTAAAERPDTVAAVVSRGGRPDLAHDYLRAVRQATLLIVGGRDEVVIELNRQATKQLAGETRLEIVPGATHLFEEPGALEQVAGLARDWFVRHLGSRPMRDS